MIGLLKMTQKAPLLTALALAIVSQTGCGPSKKDMEAQLAKYDQLENEHTAEKAAHAQSVSELKETQKRILQLRDELKRMGVNLDTLGADLQQAGNDKAQLAQTLEEMEAALNEYKQRAAKLEAIKARFDALRTKLKQLTQLGLKVEIRHNRMVIRLPGDVLFGSGSSKLQKKGQEVVIQVADVIRKDAQLKKRYFQIAGHTDNIPLKGGRFGDNWGLSAMRAREVLLLLTEDGAEGGGGLDARLLHMSGYGDSDPVASNETKEGRQQNRRVELILLPDVEEMLNLKDM